MKDKIFTIKICSDPEILGGIWCFNGTRLPISILDDYLDGQTGFLGNAKMNYKKLYKEFPQMKSLLIKENKK